MVEIHDTHEQSEIVKGWLRENGGAIVLGLVLAFGSLFGFKQWQIWEDSQNQQASAEYEVMTALLADGNLDAAVSNYETLKADFPDSAYTSLGSLHMAKARLEAGQVDIAAQLLEHAMSNAQPEAVQIVARERLARVRLDQGDSDGALELIDGSPSDAGFESQFAEIKGDAYRLKGELDEAAKYYNAALDALETGTGNRSFLEIKLEASGGTLEAESEAS
jgi:predicted negative regulator of RcsB-dependent stress response